MRTATMVLLSFLLAACGKKSVSFQSDIQPVLNQRCTQCHSVQNPSANIVLTSYDSVMSAKVTKWKKPIVIAGNASESWLYLSCGTTQSHFRMPPDTLGLGALNDKEIELIGRWIQQGAKNN
jgi:uncharacterized membrane protein